MIELLGKHSRHGACLLVADVGRRILRRVRELSHQQPCLFVRSDAANALDLGIEVSHVNARRNAEFFAHDFFHRGSAGDVIKGFDPINCVLHLF
ncbi:MAG: hypothetical protein CSA70_03265 [Rhodobacterales bacterium]|nr:MAG: hypothetical protein CSA70_03265 [Rhodobacterales bacterium]